MKRRLVDDDHVDLAGPHVLQEPLLAAGFSFHTMPRSGQGAPELEAPPRTLPAAFSTDECANSLANASVGGDW
jgi:hypothetical protein